MTSAARIPQPRPRPLVGNVPDIDVERPVQSMMRLARELGPIFKLTFPAREVIIVSSHALVDQLCDEARFDKCLHGPLRYIRDFAGDGLFTAETKEPNWGRAHRILMPAFGPLAMRSYFDAMLDVADQLVLKWSRLGEVDLDVADNMTRLTLDTIALAGFGYRFNSFYQREMHPFVEAMVRSLGEAGARARRMPLQTKMNLVARKHYDADVAFMNEVVDELIRARRAQKPGGASAGHATAASKDLLGRMLEGADPETGERLDDLNVRNQMVTFLIAGHETTSGLLSFALYELLANPEVLAQARAEVDAVLGDATPRFEHVARLSYLDQVLRETLRLWPTAPAFALTPKKATRLAGADVRPGDQLLVLTPSLHRDPAVWGADAERFDPTRFAPARRDAIPENAWKPFGNGQRACIGRAFAMQEAILVLAMLLQRFDLVGRDDYALAVQETLTLKPEGLTLRVRPRTGRPISATHLATAPAGDSTDDTVRDAAPPVDAHATPMLVLYGSSAGSSEGFARQIAGDASARGYAVDVLPMDAATERLPREGAVVVVTASYNGQPPDNARRFCEWLDGLEEGSLAGLGFAVFGCGHRDWATTYQAVPTRVDEALARAGAKRLHPRGAADARADFFGDFERWHAPAKRAIDEAFEVDVDARPRGPVYAVRTIERPPHELARAPGYVIGHVVENRELVDLTSPFGRSKRHLVLELPAETRYRTGDYLSVVAENPPELVARAAARFGLDLDTVLELSSAHPAAARLPLGRAVTVRALLASHVELAQPATRGQIEALVAGTACPPERQRLAELVSEAAWRTHVLEARVSLLDLLEDAPAARVDFADFLEMLPASRPRLYSIASSPRVAPTRVALTVAVVEGPARSGRGTYRGVASTWLARASVGSSLLVAVKSPNQPFTLPEDGTRPLVLVAAGSGIAPFRGFLEERAARAAKGERLGPAALFFGCDHPDVDFLYADELARWEQAGVVRVYPAFFRAPAGEVTFVQHRLWAERATVRALLDDGASVFVCGDGARMAPAVRATLGRVLTGGGDGGRAVAELEATGRLVADVFS